MFIAVGTPLRDKPTAAPQGTLVAAYEISDSLARAIQQATSSDVVFFALDTLNRPYVVGSTVPREDIGPALITAVRPEALAADSGGEGVAMSAAMPGGGGGGGAPGGPGGGAPPPGGGPPGGGGAPPPRGGGRAALPGLRALTPPRPPVLPASA